MCSREVPVRLAEGPDEASVWERYGEVSRRKKPLSDVSKADSERITEKQRKPPLR
jgi:hypothetical protein